MSKNTNYLKCTISITKTDGIRTLKDVHLSLVVCVYQQLPLLSLDRVRRGLQSPCDQEKSGTDCEQLWYPSGHPTDLLIPSLLQSSPGRRQLVSKQSQSVAMSKLIYETSFCNGLLDSIGRLRVFSHLRCLVCLN